MMSRVGRFWLMALLPLAILLWQFTDFMPKLTASTFSYLLLAIVGWYGVIAGIYTLLSWPFTFALRRFSGWLMVPVAAITGALLWVDLEVFEQYRFHLSPFVFQLFLSQPGEVIEFSWFTWLVSAGAMLLSLLLFTALWRLSLRQWKQWPVWSLIIIAFLSGEVWHAIADARGMDHITILTRNLPIYQPMTAKRFMARHGWAVAHPTSDALNVKEKGALHYPLTPVQAAKQPKMNVLYLLVDTWRADELTPSDTPNVEAFSKTPDTTRYFDHFSGGNSTQAGIFSLFYSLPATYWAAFDESQKPPVLMNLFKNAGYQFGVYGSATLRSPAFDKTVFSGIRPIHSEAGIDRRWKRDHKAVNQFEQFLDNRDKAKPFFGFLFFDGVHAYDFPDNFDKKVNPYWDRVDHIKLSNSFNPKPYFDRYRTAVRYSDQLIGQLLGYMKQHHLLDNTIIIISADHGEEFNEHHMNYWGHGSNYSDTQTKVPLVIHWPGKEGGEVHYRTSHFDLTPTLATNLFGVKTPLKDYSVGKLLSDPSPRKWLLVGSYYNYALKSPNELVVTYPTGQTEVMDNNLHHLDTQPPAAAIKKALSMMGRFYH
ncbi:sulfatase-like hydrolase/transferase [Gallaecimonas mangrovi]|uniref:sulfatase-like hydrolase/transferase n=1 Tax=Gallaecimonas mangrovi TaxID=2291597 RepID=UPI0018688DC9|nr:sulfatase-like hydrolase/transferase [Gallaecimonas mangrovi]